VCVDRESGMGYRLAIAFYRQPHQRARESAEAEAPTPKDAPRRADQRKKLERLCGYISQPVIAERRLSLTPNAQRKIYLTTNASAQWKGFDGYAPWSAAPMRWSDLTRGERRRSDKIGLISGLESAETIWGICGDIIGISQFKPLIYKPI